ncbi:MAG TPA: DUF3455 domain-containing protein [Stellaceae bacterium]|nr:DUF3455 domain-containing protein [Stellaceae bacterium]
MFAKGRFAFAFYLAALSGIALAASPPDTLKPPSGEVLAFQAAARGVQIYECRKTGDQYAWALVGPEAELFDDGGAKIGRHFTGPTWEAADGSRVVGKVAAKADAPDGKSVAWLLLTAASHEGAGRMADVTSVQRLDTQGGAAPATGCGAEHAGERTRSPYQANYLFYHPAPPK